MLISIVGKSGSGKSHISTILASYIPNSLHIDLDNISHQILENPLVKQNLVSTFGKNIMIENKINRKELGKIVFNSTKKMQQLTDITWNKMENVIDQIIENNSNKIIILDWLLLPKTKYFELSSLKILVDAPLEIRMERAMKRDNISSKKFLEREQAAMNFQNYKFDYIINNINLLQTQKKVKKIYDKSIISR